MGTTRHSMWIQIQRDDEKEWYEIGRIRQIATKTWSETCRIGW